MSIHIDFDLTDLFVGDCFISEHAACEMIMDYEDGLGPKPPFKYSIEEVEDGED